MSEDGSRRIASLSVEKQALLALQRKKKRAAESAARSGGAEALAPSVSGTPPLSFAQQRLWLLDRLEPGTTAYNMPMASRLRGPLDRAALERALEEIVRRHEALRTTFGEKDGEGIQVVAPASPFRICVADLSALPPEAREAEEEAALASSLRPFDLESGPLFRASLFRLAPTEHVLLLDVHHIVFDGWSVGVLFRELGMLYADFQAGRPSSLPTLPLQYAAFAAWQRDRLRGAVLDEQLAYWRQTLQGAPAALDLPLDRLRPARPTHRGGTARSAFPLRLAARLRELALRERASPFMVLLAVFQLLLGRLAGAEDVVVGSPSAGRVRRDVEGSIGLFLNNLVLRTDLSRDPTFRKLLDRVKDSVLGAYRYQEVPFERLLQELQIERDLSRTPLFQVLFNYFSFSGLQMTLPGLQVDVLDSDSTDAKFDFTLYVHEQDDLLRCDLVYSTDLFEAPRMEELLRQLEHLAAQVVEAPETQIDSLSLITPGPLGSLGRLPDPTAGLSDAWHGPVHRALARWALTHPDRVAVEDASGAVWGYGELERRANRLARFLLAHGVERGDAVAIWAERSASLVQAILGTFKAGAAILILDPSYPAQRILDYLRIGRPTAWVAVPGAPPPAPEVKEAAALFRCSIELSENVLDGLPDDDPAIEVGPDDIACLTFTSGSTGTPKGVAGRHGGLTHFYPWMGRRFAVSAEDRFSVLSALTHDPLQRDLFTALWFGGRIVLPDPARIGSPGYLAAWLRDRGVTFANLTPAMMELVLESVDDEDAGAETISALPALRLAFVVGDQLKKENVRRLQELAPGLLCVNLYGSTETQRALSYFVVPRGPELDRLGKDVLPLGAGMEDCQLLVLDSHGRQAGVGEPGEIHIRSRHLARGYLGDEVLTAQRFIANPYLAVTDFGDRLYRTGDLGRYLPAGDVEMMGRADFQVKIRGFRIELGEIEAALTHHPEVREAVVVVREDSPGERRLVAYLVVQDTPEGVEPRELRSSLAAQLPDYMVPAAFVLLPALPLTLNGKVDRKALPAPQLEAQEVEVSHDRGPVTELLSTLWAELLGRAGVAPDESFFELGGHSLLATRMISRVRSLLGVELPLRALFEEPTLRGFAVRIERQLAAGAGSEAPPLVPVPRGEELPASFAQQRLWFLQQLDPESFAYNLTGAVRLEGKLDVEALGFALDEIVRRHEALRTSFVDRGGEPWQSIAEPAPQPLPLVDLTALQDERRQEEALAIVAAFARRPYDLRNGPVLRTLLLRSGDDDHGLALGMHHIVSDAWSVNVFLRELRELYRPGRPNRASYPALPELAIQYADYAAWQRGWLQGAALEERLAWWTRKLSGAPPVLELPLDRPRPSRQQFRGHRTALPLAPDRSGRIEAAARRLGATPFMTYLAVFAALLARYSGQRDLVIGTPIANRERAELEDLIGFFANTLALRVDLAGDPDLATLAGRVRDVSLGAYARQEVPFERLVDELKVERSLGHSPVFQVSFALQNVPPAALDLAGLTLTPLELDPGRTPFDLSLFVQPLPQGGSLTYLYAASALFDAATARRLLGHFHNLLAVLAQDGQGERLPLSALPLLSRAERSQVVEEWNDSATPFPHDATVHGLFAATARRFSTAAAVVGDGESLSYAELDRRSDRIAAHLAGAGVRPDDAVGVCAERSPNLIAALLGILKAGAGYVPLDPAYPGERLAGMLADGGIRTLLIQEGLEGKLPESGAIALSLESAAGTDAEPFAPVAVDPCSLAYIVFTSGSTGRPKGVAVSHRSVVRLVRDTHYCRFGPDETFLQLAPVAFDASTFEIWGPLLNGGKLALFPPGPVDLPRLGRALEAHGVTTLFLTAGLFHQMVESHLEALWPVRQLLSGGDFLSPSHVERVVKSLPDTEMIHVYGPTEVTTYTTHLTVTAETRLGITIPIGGPISNTRVYVLDAGMEPTPIGVVGELYAAGPGLARGYAARPDLTAERFVPDPVGGIPGERLYATGDLARWLPDGRVELLGRRDNQVKVRGFRIELGEIEAALVALPEVEAAVVMARADASGDKRLVAYLLARDGEVLATAQLRLALEARLPAYMIPAAFVVLPAFPLDPNGKVNRRALPEPDLTHRASVADEARGAMEEIVAGLWSDLLGLPQIGSDESFFGLGGHSLLATRMVSRIRSELGIEVPLRAVFEEPVLAPFAARVELLRQGGAIAAALPLLRVPRGGLLPVSFSQQRLWFLQRFDPASITYNMTGAARLDGALSLPALAQAFSAIAARHESLRTVFVEAAGEPWQKVLDAAEVALPLVDLSALPAELRAGEARRLARSMARDPYDLESGPLLQTRLLQLSAGANVLLLGMHHIVSDGWSMSVFYRELAELYRSAVERVPPALAELPLQYADYAAWQRRWLDGAAMEERIGWWANHLRGAPRVLDLPLDRPRPSVQSQAGHRTELLLEAPLAAAFEASARRLGVTPFMAYLAAFAALLGRHSGQRDLVLGTPIANRERSELEGLIGFFVNTLALRIDLAGDPSFAELARRARRTALGAYDHQEVPFDRLVDELRVERSLNHSPIFQAVLALQNLPSADLELAGLTLSPLEFDSGRTHFDLSLILVPLAGQEGVLAQAEAAAALFEPTTIRRLLSQLRNLVAAIGEAGVEIRLSELPLLGPAERAQLVAEWNDSTTAFPRDSTIHGLFADFVRLQPDAVALIGEGETLTYAELDRRAERIAAHLMRAGVRQDEAVGLCAERSPNMIAALLGILKAGGAYVPLASDYPRERLAGMLADAAIRTVLIQDSLESVLPSTAAARLSLEAAALSDAPPPDRPVAVDPLGLAYVIFTSGSTGRPKGVAIPHRGVVRLVRNVDYCRFGPDETFLQLAPIAFDPSTFEIWGPLLNGGRLALFPPGPIDLARLGRELETKGVTTLLLTSGLFHQVIESHLESLRPVRQLVSGGDFLSPSHVRRLVEALPGTELLHAYGPTEVTAFTTSIRVTRETALGATVPLGGPIANTTVYVLDADLGPVPIGVTGELYAGGDGLGRCYLGRPDLTAERFVPDPMGYRRGEPGARLYATGDLARWLSSGSVELLGRRDSQVKVRGFRIELGEIETALTALPGIEAAIVVTRTDAAGDKRLIGYVVGPEGEGRDVVALRSALEATLPPYMVPAAIVPLAAFPLDPNGKVDRRALPEPEAAPRAGGGESGTRTPIEEILAGIWSDLLGVKAIAGHESFFELGGHSLLATRMVSQVRSVLGVEIPLRTVFEGPTLAALARAIDGARLGSAGQEAPPLARAPHADLYPTTFSQQRLWFLQQLDPLSFAYNLTSAIRLRGRLRFAALESALREIVSRHGSLRTTFVEREGEPWQRIEETSDVTLPLIDLTALSERRRSLEAERLANDHDRRPYDLARGPLLRLALLRLQEEEHGLLSGMHHIVTDGWSIGLFQRELSELYGASLLGHEPDLAELPVQYADYAVWQREWLRGELLAKRIEWWTERLAGAPAVTELPLDRPRPAQRSHEGHVARLRIDGALTEQFESLARRPGLTPFMAYLGAYSILLARYGGQSDVVIGSPIANRGRAELEGVIGFFVNTLALRIQVDDAPSFRALALRLRELTLGAYAHQDVPFERLVDELEVERDTRFAPVFQVTLALQNLPDADPELEGLALSPFLRKSPGAQFDLSLILAPLGGQEGIEARLYAASDLFDPTTTQRILEHFVEVLKAIVEPGAVDRSSAEIPLLTAGERRQLADWNETSAPFRLDRCLHELVTDQAWRTPHRVAVRFDGLTLTYAELDGAAARLARRLRAAGAGLDGVVGVLAERSLEMVVGLLAVLRAGGAYLPLDPDYPAERLALMLDDARAPVLLAQDSLLGRLLREGLQTRARIVPLDPFDPGLDALAEEPLPERTAEPGSLAYVIYTSGSTGRPKGTMVPHTAIVSHLLWMAEALPLEASDRVLQKTPFGFDASAWEIWAPLLSGAELVLAKPGEHRDPEALVHRIQSEGATVLQVVPSLLSALLESPGFADCRTLRRVCCGGEALSAALVESFFATLDAELHNFYGPTETTVEATAWACERGPRIGPVPIGRPVANTAVQIVSPAFLQQPIGVAGELLVGGRQVTRGYLGRPELTAERYVPDPFGSEAGARLYRTGDLARWTSEGVLEFLGRIDHQVKIRGNRIELGEIETALLRLPDVEAAIVQAHPDAAGALRLVAYVVGGGLTSARLRHALRRELPEPMIPGAFVFLAALPLTPNGKVDRRALPAPEGDARSAPKEETRSPSEELLATIWSDLLGVAPATRHESFFDLGGHSLLATRLVSQVRRTLGVELPLRAVFEDPSLAGIALRIELAREDGAGIVAPPLVRQPRNGPLPTSFSQRRLWFLDRLEPDGRAYNQTAGLRLIGDLDVAALTAAIAGIVGRHEALRTVFLERNGEPWQVIEEPSSIALRQTDLSLLGVDEREEELLRLAQEQSERRFDLAHGPLFRPLLVRLGEHQHALILNLHHIVSDGWSMSVFVRELRELYRAFALGEEPSLPALAVQYADYAAWQREWLQGQVMAERVAWWTERLRGAPPVTELPLDRPRPSRPSGQAHRLPLALEPELAEHLDLTSRKLGVTPFMVSLAAFATLLSRFGGGDDLVVGTPIANRSRAELEDLIGFFVNTLALRLHLDGDPSFAALARRVREITLGAFAHQDVPFERLVDELKIERSLSHTPVFQVSFAFQNQPQGYLELAGLALAPLAIEPHQAPFDLSLFLMSTPDGGMRGDLYASSDLFDAATGQRLLGHYRQLLRGLVEDPSSLLSELPLLDPAEREEVLHRWNEAEDTTPLEPVHRLFFAWAERTPDAIAVVSEDGTERWTYGELACRARALAARLRARGVVTESLVAVRIARSPRLVAAALAVLEAGAAYLPIDPAQPQARADWTIADSGAQLLITDEDFDDLPLSSGAAAMPSDDPDRLAYVIYTSGSTGTPKGTELRHRGLSKLIAWHRQAFDLGPADRTMLLASPGFDASIWDMFAALTAGAALHIPSRETILSPSALLAWMADRRIAVSFVTTSLAEALLAEPMPASLALRTLLTGGERLKRRPAPDTPFTLVNAYGPTEATVVVAAGRVEPEGETLPHLGRAVAHARIYLLDRWLQPVPLGAPGELCIAGEGLARGYRLRPALTAQSFLPDPYSRLGGERLYRTGDLARRHPSGDIEFVGRIDQQVKLRGFRIELGEIEAVLADDPTIRESVVTLQEIDGSRRLVAYVVPAAGAVAAGEIKTRLSERLPEYMVPGTFVFLERLPLGASGKIDRRALPLPEGQREDEAESYVAPRSMLEEVMAQIWAQVLHLDRVGVHDDFWDLGGHSLLATQVLSRINAALSVEVPLRELFRSPTIAGLSVSVGEALLDEAKATEGPDDAHDVPH